MTAFASLIADHRAAAMRIAAHRNEALRGMGRTVETRGDPFCAPCGYCHGTGSTAEFSRDSGATIRTPCEACGGNGAKEGSEQ